MTFCSAVLFSFRFVSFFYLQSNDYRLELLLSLPHQIAKTSFNFLGDGCSLWHIVEEGHDLLVQFADNTPRPLSVPHGFLPSLAECGGRDAQFLGSFRLGHVEIFGDVNEILAIRHSNRINDSSVGLAGAGRHHSRGRRAGGSLVWLLLSRGGGC